MVLTQNLNFFVEPFTFRELRLRCLFKKGNKGMNVFFHLAEKEIFADLTPLPQTIFLYGAYNQVTVCQMKSLGNIREMTLKEKDKFVRLIKDRLDGKEIGDELPLKPLPEEKTKAWQLINSGSGKFYCFQPLSYEYNIYERG